MEIKKTPRAAGRAVEEGGSRSKWPLLLAVIIIIIILLAAAVAYFYSLSRKTEPLNAPVASQESTATVDNGQPVSTIKPKPLKVEATKLIFARSAKAALDSGSSDSALPNNQVDLAVYFVDTRSSDLQKIKLGTVGTAAPGTHLAARLSPNGQFAYLINPTACSIYLVDLSASDAGTGDDKLTQNSSEQLSGLTLSAKKIFSCKDGARGPEKAVWLPDSSGILFSAAGTDSQADGSSWVLYDLPSGQTKDPNESGAVDTAYGYTPLVLIEDELFVIRHNLNSGAQQKLGVIKLADQQFTGKFEKIMTAPDDLRGSFAITDDGQLVAWARRETESGSSTYFLELLDRATGEIKELRKSSTAAYSDPLFDHQATKLYYSAASGLWSYDLTTDQREQLIENTEVPKAGQNGIILPLAARPDDGALIVRINPGGAGQTIALGVVNTDKPYTLGVPEREVTSPELYWGWR